MLDLSPKKAHQTCISSKGISLFNSELNLCYTEYAKYAKARNSKRYCTEIKLYTINLNRTIWLVALSILNCLPSYFESCIIFWRILIRNETFSYFSAIKELLYVTMYVNVLYVLFLFKSCYFLISPIFLETKIGWVFFTK